MFGKSLGISIKLEFLKKEIIIKKFEENFTWKNSFLDFLKAIYRSSGFLILFCQFGYYVKKIKK